MIATLFVLAAFGITTFAAENAYQSFSIVMPMPLAGHITAVYDGALYVFGGKNDSSQGAGASAFKNTFYKLPLNKLALSGTTAITSSPALTASDWEVLTVTPPSYGESSNNEFYCEGQCSALIGQYLYIVGPYSSASSSLYDRREHVYRLDLSQNPPVFAAQSSLPSYASIGYQTSETRQCVTAANNVLFTISGGYGAGGYSLESVKYDPSTNTQTPLASMPSEDQTYAAGRQNAGCAGNIAGTAVYLFGGKAQKRTYGAPGVDTYDVSNDAWTENGQTDEFDTQNGASGNSRQKMSCFNQYSHTVECVGGWGVKNGVLSSMDTAIVWNYDDRSEEYVSMAYGVFSAGVALYEIKNDGTVAASVVLVTGGVTNPNSMSATDNIQYAVRHVTITQEPSASPVRSPSVSPTPMPSRSPLCAGCTHAPSLSPVTATPTTSPIDASSSQQRSTVKVWTVVTFMIIMISAVVYV